MDVRLPHLLQLDWCMQGPREMPWFPDAPDDLQVRLLVESPIEYVDPVASAMLAAWCAHRAATAAPVLVDESLKSPYAWRIGLLSALAGRPRDTGAASDRILPVAHVPEQGRIEPLLVRVRRLLHLNEETTNAVVYCLSELLRNVFEHSGSPLGAFVAASYFPSTDRVTLCVADLGITVPAHVKRQYSDEIADDVALKIALEPGASGSFDRDRNAGLGLYMTRRIADMTGGKFWLLTASLCARNDGNADSLGASAAMEITPIQNRWRGTVAALTLYPRRLDSFERALRAANAQLLGPAVGRTQGLFRRKEIKPGSLVLRVPPDAANIAQDKVAAQRIRDEQILPALREGKELTLDFSGVALTTQSFAHALLAAPFKLIGPAALPSRLCFRACSTQVREVILLVMGYTLEPEES